MRRQEELNRLEEKTQMEIQRRMEQRSVSFVKHCNNQVFKEATFEMTNNTHWIPYATATSLWLLCEMYQ